MSNHCSNVSPTHKHTCTTVLCDGASLPYFSVPHKKAKFATLALCHNIIVFADVLCTVYQNVVGTIWSNNFGRDASMGINPEILRDSCLLPLRPG